MTGLGVPALVGGLAGCEGPLSILQPAGPSAQAIARVWWGMAIVGGLVWAGVAVAWLLGMRRGRGARGGHGPLHAEAARRSGWRWIIGGGVILPSVAVVALLVLGSPAARHQLPLAWGEPAQALQVRATGRQWWWELRYLDAPGVVLRNELRVPVGRPIDVHTASADVIHSFWVPRLGGKLDAIPGRTLVVRLQADAPGTYRGVCAEFCGLGHAHMAMTVVALPAAEFEAWLQAQSAGAASPAAAARAPQRLAGAPGRAESSALTGAAP